MNPCSRPHLSESNWKHPQAGTNSFHSKKVEVKDDEKFIVSLPVAVAGKQRFKINCLMKKYLSIVLSSGCWSRPFTVSLRISLFCSSTIFIAIERNFSGQEVYMCIDWRLYVLNLPGRNHWLCTGFKNKFSKARFLIQFVAGTVLPTTLVILVISLYFTYVIGYSIAFTQPILFTIIFALTAILYNVLYVSNEYQFSWKHVEANHRTTAAWSAGNGDGRVPATTLIRICFTRAWRM